MAKKDMDEFMAEWAKRHGQLDMPGAMLMKYGPEDYVGATIAVRGTLYFKGAHTSAVRETLCQCFDAYEAVAKEHLKWLWRDEPPSGPNKFTYAKAPALRAMVSKMDEDDHFGFAYSGGEKSHDASPWNFSVFGHRAWQARMGSWGPDSLIFSVPPEAVASNPRLFQELFVEFCRLLEVDHGHGGFAFNLSLVRKEPNQPTEAFMVSRMAGLDAGSGHIIGGLPDRDVEHHLVTIGWLTAINHAMVGAIGGLSTLRSELPASWFAKYDYGAGVVIQAGPEPEIAPVELDPKPAIYVLPAMTLRKVRLMADLSLHYGSKDGEPRLTGLAAKEWLTRFDVRDDELMHYKTKLLSEPTLTQATTLPERL